MNIKNEIKCMLDKINSEEELNKIREVCRDAMPMTLDQYIDSEFGCAPKQVKNKFKCEAIEFYTMLNNETIITDEPCDDWYKIYVKGHGDLDIWIHGYYPIFNPSRLAMCVYKLWSKEVLINE